MTIIMLLLLTAAPAPYTKQISRPPDGGDYIMTWGGWRYDITLRHDGQYSISYDGERSTGKWWWDGEAHILTLLDEHGVKNTIVFKAWRDKPLSGRLGGDGFTVTLTHIRR